MSDDSIIAAARAAWRDRNPTQTRGAAPVLAAVLLGTCLGPVLAGAADRVIRVAAGDGGDFKTVQEAVAAVPDNSTERSIIQIRAGRYEGPVVISSKKNKVTFQGEDARTTVIDWPNNVKSPKPPGADGFNPGVHIRGSDFCAEHLTFSNSSGDQGQGLALRVDGDRAVFAHCRLLGWQDTLMANQGRQYFTNCYIEGRVDFIFGDGAAVFEDCHIHSKNGGYITAASTPAGQKFGYVFLRCNLTGDTVPWAGPGATTPVKEGKFPNAYLGRPWRPQASVAFIACKMGGHIRPEGWHNWGNPTNEATARFAEYGSTGPGGQPDRRAPWARRLNKAEAAAITAEAVLAGADGWSPYVGPKR
jgi:pectinesterase